MIVDLILQWKGKIPRGIKCLYCLLWNICPLVRVKPQWWQNLYVLGYLHYRHYYSLGLTAGISARYDSNPLVQEGPYVFSKLLSLWPLHILWISRWCWLKPNPSMTSNQVKAHIHILLLELTMFYICSVFVKAIDIP